MADTHSDPESRSEGTFYRQVFEGVSDAIFVYDPANGSIVDVNPAAAELTGYSVGTLRGRPVTQFTAGSPDHVETAVAELVEDAFSGDQTFQWFIERADGEIRTTEVSIHRTTIAGADRVLALMRDVTDEKRKQAELEATRDRLSLLTEASPDVFWMFSADWEQCLYINDAYETVWGRSTDSLTADPTDFLAGVNPDDRDIVRNAMERMSNGSRVTVEYRVNEGEGFGRWVWVEGVPIYDDDGELIRHAGFARDITERKQLAVELSEQTEALTALTDNVPVVLFEIDEDGRFTQLKGRQVTALDIDADRSIGRSIFDVFAGNDAICDAAREALDGNAVRETIDIGGLTLDAWFEPTHAENGTLEGVIGVAVDVTEREQYQTALQANEQALSDLYRRGSQSDLSSPERIEALLDVGRERLGLGYGFLTRIDDGTQHIVEALGTHEALQSGASAPLEEAYCRKTVVADGLVGVENAPSEGWEDDPAYQRFDLHCYLGGKIEVDGEVYGTVCFADSEPRDQPFSQFERTFVELLIQWLEFELQHEQQEAVLRTARDELSSVLSTSPLAIVELDTDAAVKRWNDAAETMFGVPESEAVGSTFPAVPSSMRETLTELFDRVLAGETLTGYELSQTRPDGTVRTLALNAAPIEATSGTYSGVVATFADITAQKRSESRIDALRRATRQLLAVTDETEVGTIAVETAAEALGYPVCAMWIYDDTDDVLRPLAETDTAREVVGPAPTVQRGEGLFWEAFTTGEIQRLDSSADRADIFNPETELHSEIIVPIGRYGVFAVSSTATDAFGDSDVDLLETLSDTLTAALNSVSDRRLLNRRREELERQNEQLDEFASVVAHDIRGPLTAARGFLELALETNDEQLFERVDQAHARMEQFINDLLTLARQGKSISDPEPTDFRTVVEAAGTAVPSSATLVIEGDLPTRPGDGSRLEQVFSNLFRNAVEHGGADVTITVGSLSDGAGVFIENDGEPIPRARQPHIFGFGYTDSPTGTGVGLAIVSEIVEAHGWTISVTDAEGGGPRFEILFGADGIPNPLAEPAE
ncbi:MULTISPECIES: PAS domain S-box protein [Haloarcula]|uniref:PAS domain S-box protein n=1 Tax=Haloarcula TaxID=2237 RepID=UPI0023EBDDAD|nr:PAS domain S-box protein [Halomicroarcula sp. XH51]